MGGGSSCFLPSLGLSRQQKERAHGWRGGPRQRAGTSGDLCGCCGTGVLAGSAKPRAEDW